MKFLLCHSDRFHAQRANLPLAGSFVELHTMIDLLLLQEKMGAKLIIHPPSYVPTWVQYHDLNSPLECEEEHQVFTLPVDHHQHRWIEVYNGYRE